MELMRFNPLSKDTDDSPGSPARAGETQGRRRKSRFWRIFWTAIGPLLALALTVVVTLTVVGVIDWGKMTGRAGAGEWFSNLFSRAEAPQVQASDYWAVFLTSNQVYFGKLSGVEGQYLTLTDVFYLRAQRRLQPPEEADEAATQPQERQEVQLIKLGDELHGPVDEIRFNRDNVLFLERLKSDSRVVKGIEQFKAQLP